jgi:hypothetical protein
MPYKSKRKRRIPDPYDWENVPPEMRNPQWGGTLLAKKFLDRKKNILGRV